MKKNKPIFFIIVAITMLMTYATINGIHLGSFNLKGANEMRFGTDIKGGVNAVFQPAIKTKPTESQLEAARSVIETRLDAQNILDREVTIDKQGGFVIVNFPWKSNEKNFDPAKAIAELGDMAELKFTDSEGNKLMEGSHVTKSAPTLDKQTGQYVVSLTFDAEGTKELANVTTKYYGKEMDIYMDNKQIQKATIEAKIMDGECIINGMKDYDEAKDLSNKINSGALPFSMVTKNYNTISPSLGQGALKVMVEAGLIAFAIICVLLLFYYRLCGFVACISLLIQITGQILLISVPQMSLTLQGIAGIILSIGLGVDANVISSERISEEIKGGKSSASAIASGFESSFAAIFDGNITVLIVAFIMMTMGSGSLLSFGYTLFAGIIFNFIGGVTASRLMIRSLNSFKFLQKPSLYTCWSRRVTYDEQ